MKNKLCIFLSIVLGTAIGSRSVFAQSVQDEAITINLAETFQTMEGFGASLAYYENWLTAHPNKSEIYEAVFAGLSLDILRVRNAHEYDPTMIGRVAEFAQAAEDALGRPIPILSSSWGPPARLKSNNDRNNGGTLKYTADGSGVKFDYAGFAGWWDSALDEYQANGVYPEFISIQNEPEWEASWETCRLNPDETVTATDTIAGYNVALDAVHDTLARRESMPKILGPESIGIGYNNIENYTNALDVSKLYGIAHHLYHGVDENDPWSSINFSKVGIYRPDLPHFQTEYSGGDWFSLGGLIYKSLRDENAVAYLYWDLTWNDGGLVALDNPWYPAQWTFPRGYNLTKDYYAFKQFSAFIHPGWQRIAVSPEGNDCKTLAFLNPGKDSLSLVVVNRSATDSMRIHVGIPGYSIDTSSVFVTSETRDFAYEGRILDGQLKVPPHCIASARMRISVCNSILYPDKTRESGRVLLLSFLYPNPFSQSAILQVSLGQDRELRLMILDVNGRKLRDTHLGHIPAGDHRIAVPRDNLEAGIYIYRLESAEGEFIHGWFVIH